MKRLLILLLALALSISMTACGGAEGESSPAPSEPASRTEPESTGGGETQTELAGPIAEGPILLTSVGQSADVEMVKVMMERAELTPEVNSLATADDIGAYKTLVLAIGGSSKGLGAAGIDADQELERVVGLIGAAKNNDMVVIAVHVGGEARRGELSDKFIAPSFESADYAVVVAEGDKDGLMQGLAADAGIPIVVVDSMADVVEPLAAAFK